MATILAHITVKPGTEAEFEAISRPVFAGTQANEPHMRIYEYFRGAAPRTYYVLLAFDDFHGFLEHQVADYHESMGEPLGELIETMELEWVDPIEQASTLPNTAMADAAPADAGERARFYFDNYAANVQDWWLAQRQA